MSHYSRRSFLERGLEWSSQKFGNFTLMNQYTDTMKMWFGLITQSKVLNAAKAVAGGKKLSKKEITKLAHIGIDESCTTLLISTAATVRIWTVC